MKESRHILAYADRTFRLKGSISKGGKIDEEKCALEPKLGLTPPFAYGSNQCRLYESCDKDDIVWIVGIAKHHHFPSVPSCTWERHIDLSWALTPYHHYAKPI
jgi:hypothetical protein